MLERKRKIPSVTSSTSEEELISSTEQIENIPTDADISLNTLNDNIESEFESISKKFDSDFEMISDSIFSIQKTNDIILNTLFSRKVTEPETPAITKNFEVVKEPETPAITKNFEVVNPSESKKEHGTLEDVRIRLGQIPAKEKTSESAVVNKIDNLEDLIVKEEEDLKSYIDEKFEVKQKSNTTEDEAVKEPVSSVINKNFEVVNPSESKKEHGTLEDVRIRLGQIPAKEKTSESAIVNKIDNLEDLIVKEEEDLKSYIDENFEVKQKSNTTEDEAVKEQQQREDYERLYQFLKDRFPLLADKELESLLKDYYDTDTQAGIFGKGKETSQELEKLNKNLENLEKEKRNLSRIKTQGKGLIGSITDLISGNLGKILIGAYLGHILTSDNWEKFRNVVGLPKNEEEWKKFALDTGTVASRMLEGIHKEWPLTKIINGPLLVTAGLMTKSIPMILAGGALVAADVERAKKEQPTSPYRATIAKAAADVASAAGKPTTQEEARGVLDPFLDVVSFNLIDIPKAIFRDTSQLSSLESRTGLNEKGLSKLYESFIKRKPITFEESVEGKQDPAAILHAVGEYLGRSQHKDWQSDETIKSMVELQQKIDQLILSGKTPTEDDLGKMFLEWYNKHGKDPKMNFLQRANVQYIKEQQAREKAKIPEAVYSKFIVPFMQKKDASDDEKIIIAQMQNIENDKSISRQEQIKRIYDIYYKNVYPGTGKITPVKAQTVPTPVSPAKSADKTKKLSQLSESGKNAQNLSKIIPIESSVNQTIVNNDNRSTVVSKPLYPGVNNYLDSWFRYHVGASRAFDIQNLSVNG